MSDSNVDQEDLESLSANSAENAHLPTHNQVAKTDKSKPRSQNRETVRHKMYVFCRDFCLLFVLIFTYFQNSAPKISKSPPAFPFFPKGSLVKDWYHGQLSEAIELASQSDLAFVMFYAPWDAESQAVKHEFDTTALHMHTTVHFSAINCWHPNSECRQQYSKVYSWPVLMAYPAHGRGIEYRGPKKFENMIRFLQIVTKPLKRVYNLGEVMEFLSVRDAVVVGFLDTKLGSNDFGVYYSAALRFLERDPFGEIEFLIYVGKVEYDLPLLQLYLWNETLSYSDVWKPESITSWISDSLHQISLWVNLPESKSQYLSTYLNLGPALILFTPKNPLHTQTDFYSVLHDVALDYHNCNNNLGIKMQKMLLSLTRKAHHSEYKNLENKCLPPKKLHTNTFPTVVTYDLHNLWLNNTCKINKQEDLCHGRQKTLKTCSTVVKMAPVTLNKMAADEDIKFGGNFELEDNSDPLSPKNLQNLQKSDKCYFFRLANKLQPAVFAPLNTTWPDSVNFTGLACKTNASLSILALDSLQYYFLAESLGIDILKRPDKSAVVIINSKFDTHHVMENSFTTENLKKFIFDFSKGILDRTLSSAINSRKFTHHYKFQGSNYYNTSQNIYLISELNTFNFIPTVMQQNTAVMVLYYSKSCAFCSGITHSVLTTARILAPVKELHFARIDGGSHSLPWEFSMHHFPSILYFPPKRKSDSRVFPQNVPITIPNILAFILANVDSNMKLRIMWTICNQTTFNDDMEKCVKSVRNECMTMIGKLLRAYRFTYDVHQRTVLLKYLQYLRSLHFLLTNPLNLKEIQKYLSLLRSVEINSENYDRIKINNFNVL